MDAQRLAHLSEMADCDEDVALQLQSEGYLDLQLEADRNRRSFEDWIEEEGRRYLAPKAEKPDREEIDKLAEEGDF